MTNDLAQTMRAKAEAVSAVVQVCASRAEAFAYAAETAKAQGAVELAAPTLPEADRAALTEALAARGVTLVESGLRGRSDGLKAGLTEADFGIAETGTLVMNSADEERRLASMIVDTHFALLPASRIRPDAASLKDEIRDILGRAPGFLAFITGPSRTADIERVLALGVHGPLELHILILEGE